MFCACVLFFKDNASIFDSVWAKVGFCVSNPTVPYWTSHDLCMYVGLALAGVIGILYYKLHDKDGMAAANTLAFPALFGVAAHGMGHGGIGQAMRSHTGMYDELIQNDSTYLAAMRDKTWEDISIVMIRNQLGFVIFWLCILKAAMPKLSMVKGVLPLSMLSWLTGLIFIKSSFQFTYVQTVLLIAIAVNQLCLPKEDKGFAFLVYGIVGLPVGIVGWMESVLCSSTIIHYGGHVLYDAYIPIGLLGFYLTCYAYRDLETAKIKAD